MGGGEIALSWDNVTREDKKRKVMRREKTRRGEELDGKRREEVTLGDLKSIKRAFGVITSCLLAIFNMCRF